MINKSNSQATATRLRAIIVGAQGLIAAAAAIISINVYASDTNVTYVENALTSAPVLLYSYGTVNASSVSPCFGTGCQNTSGNPFTTSSSSNASSGGIASAKSSADLSTGILGAYAQELGTTGSSAAAAAGFWDTLTFSGVGAGSPMGTMVFTLPGAFTDVGNGAACEGYLIGSSQGSTCGGSSTGSDPFATGTTSLNSGNPSETLTLNFSLQNGVATKLAWALGAAANNSFNIATADLYDPPQVSLELPSGVTYSSSSGVFLGSGSPAPVPLPASFPLLASGLAGLLVLSRRRGAVKRQGYGSAW
ncbi:MAG: hypothetical protein ACYC9J_02340 [Sulfuricaulis sp.]